MAEAVVPYGRKTQRAPAVKDVHIVWMTTGLGCDGDSVSITAATQPSIEDVDNAPVRRLCHCAGIQSPLPLSAIARANAIAYDTVIFYKELNQADESRAEAAIKGKLNVARFPHSA